MEIKYIKPSELKAAEYNPRQMTEAQAQQLTDSIKRFGIVDPIIANANPERQNIVIGGHQRLKIAQQLGLELVPVHYVNLDLEKEKELNIRLNKNTGEWNWDALANNFEVDFLMGLGFTEGELGLVASEGRELDKDKMTNSLDSYLGGNIKQIVLYFDNAQFEDIIPRLERAMAFYQVSTHTDVFLKLLEAYEYAQRKETTS